MNPSTLFTHLIAATVAFGLGWFIASGQASSDASQGTTSPASHGRMSSDPGTALEAALTIEDPVERARALADFFQRTDPSAALGLHPILRERAQGLYVDEMAEMLFASWWAQSDPGTAFRNPVNPPWLKRHPWMRTVLAEWGTTEPVKAALAVQELGTGPLMGRLSGARAVVDTWLSLDTMPNPGALIGVIKQLEPMARGGAISIFLDTLMQKRGIEETLDFVRSIPPDNSINGNVQHEFLARTGVVLLDHDLDRAIRWADEQKDGANGSGVQKHLAYYWGLRDGQAAIEWAYSLPDSPAKSTVIKRAWVSFSRKHKEEAQEWIASRDPDPLMRGTFTEFIRAMAESDPQGALAMANRSTDEEMRRAMLVAVGQGWMNADPDAALDWLSSADVPPGLLEKVRSPRPRRPGTEKSALQ